MKISKDNNLPEWIRPFAQLGGGMVLKNEITLENYLHSFLAKCCPNIYEKYIIILHPFWINQKVKQLNSEKLVVHEDDIVERDFERINYKDFFNLYNEKFNLTDAIKVSKKISARNKWGTQDNAWPNYLYYPGEGEIETKELNLITESINDLYGNVETDFFYVLLKNKDWSNGEDTIINGRILDVSKIQKSVSEVNGNPSSIYPKNNSDWCIVSDYDLPFSFMGGKKELIEDILSKKDKIFDIYEIEQRFTAEKASG